MPSTNFNATHVRIFNHIQGWLLLFVISTTIFTPILSILYIKYLFEITSPFFKDYPSFYTFFYTKTLLNAIIFGWSLSIGLKLWKRSPSAVKSAQRYLVMLLSLQVIEVLLPYFCGLPIDMWYSISDSSLAISIKEAVRSIIYVGVWYRYLSISKRVQATYF